MHSVNEVQNEWQGESGARPYPCKAPELLSRLHTKDRGPQEAAPKRNVQPQARTLAGVACHGNHCGEGGDAQVTTAGQLEPQARTVWAVIRLLPRDADPNTQRAGPIIRHLYQHPCFWRRRPQKVPSGWGKERTGIAAQAFPRDEQGVLPLDRHEPGGPVPAASRRLATCTLKHLSHGVHLSATLRWVLRPRGPMGDYSVEILPWPQPTQLETKAEASPAHSAVKHIPASPPP